MFPNFYNLPEMWMYIKINNVKSQSQTKQRIKNKLNDSVKKSLKKQKPKKNYFSMKNIVLKKIK